MGGKFEASLGYVMKEPKKAFLLKVTINEHHSMFTTIVKSLPWAGCFYILLQGSPEPIAFRRSE